LLFCVLQDSSAIRLDSLLEYGVEQNPVGESNDTLALSSDVGMNPNVDDDAVDRQEEEWQKNALSKCKKTARHRIVKILVSAPLIVISGNYIVESFLDAKGIMTELFVKILVDVSLPIWDALFRVGGTLAEFAVSIGSYVPTTFLKVLYFMVTGTLGAVYASGAFLLGVAPMAVALWGPVVLATSGVVAVTEITLNQVLKFLGHGPVRPKCCCMESSPDSCALVPQDGASQPGCPSGMEHSPGSCAMTEMVKYTDTTVQGCTCKIPQGCGNNKPWKGHAWCWVDRGSGCGRRSLRGRWDYCLFGGDPLETFKEGEQETVRNIPDEIANPLASFVPNTCTKRFSPGARNPYRLGSYTDVLQGVTTAKQKGGSRECFAGFHSESLGDCAESCLVRGAVSALNVTHKCEAFAFHRTNRLCVTLPAFANDAIYSPFLKRWGGDGWQNFVSKFHGCNQESSCTAEAFLDIMATGYQVVKDSNNGFLHLRCANNANAPVRKATCHSNVCSTKGALWCFVPTNCGGWFNKCSEIPDPLDCAADISEQS